MLVIKGVIVAACAVAAMAGNPVVRVLLRRIDAASAAPGDDEDVRRARENLGLMQAQHQMPGGRWIGVLERLATFVCIVSGFAGGIAVVLGVKGLGRYAELATAGPSSRKGELFIIGTFASLLWAAAFAGLALLGWRLL
ncbi:MAG: hypothetical protein QM713_06585 [Arachnia sp.]